MELEQLQNMWLQSDKVILDKVSLDKNALKEIIQSKTANKLNWIQFKTGFSLIAQIFVVGVFISKIQFRDDLYFYIGALILGALATILLFWTVDYYLRIGKTDFSRPITSIKKQIKKVEKHKFRITKIGYALSPFALLGTVLLIGIPAFQNDLLYVFLLTLVVFIISIFYTFKYSIFEQFKKINKELDEIRQLEKE